MSKSKAAPSSSTKAPAPFYKVRLAEESADSQFFPEYSFIARTVDSVNSFAALYRKGREGAKGGPSTHEQQDMLRAMLVFACAGLDIFVKQLIKTKLPRLIEVDKHALKMFQEYVKRGLKKKKKEGELLDMIAYAIVDHTPRESFLRDYISQLTDDSQQSVKQLFTVSNASGLDTKALLDKGKQDALTAAFKVRHQIVHEMDITVDDGAQRHPGYRTRRQRRAEEVEEHTQAVLDLACEMLKAYKEKYEASKIDVKKATAI